YREISDHANIDSDFNKYVKRSSIKNVIFIVTIPMFVVTALLIALSGYSSIIKETGNLTYDFYNQQLNNLIIPSTSIDDPKDTLYSLLENMKYKKGLDTFFIISPSGEITTSNNKDLSIFFTTYLETLSPSQPEKNRVYDFY